MIEQSVTTLKAGEKGKVVGITTRDAASLRKLTVFGVLPGMELEMIQTFPVFVLEIGNTQLALDYEAASGIVVVKCV